MAPSKKKPPPKKGVSKTTPESTATASASPPTPPNWPPLNPLVPRSVLEPMFLIPSQILIARNFFTATLCKNYVAFLKTLPLVTTPGKPKRGDAVRVNDRFAVQDWGFAEMLWNQAGVQDLVLGMKRGEANEGRIEGEGEGDSHERSMVEKEELWGGEVIGLNPVIRIYRYTKGQFFDCHYDESNLVELPTVPKSTPARTTWTLLLYLTSPATGCHGGQTVFYPENLPGKKSTIQKEVVVELETGMLLLHRHGKDCMLHEGREVTEGEKWVIRTDICVKR